MAVDSVHDLVAELHLERQRRSASEQLLAKIAGSRLLAPARLVHRLTGRGPDLADAARAAAAAPPAAPVPDDITRMVIDDFHRIYYDAASTTWQDTRWLGHRAMKLPSDLWLYQELIVETCPDLIIETGTHDGGGALYLACVCELIGNGRVITVDITEYPTRPSHPRLEFVVASSVEPATVAMLAERAEGQRTMVILDSEHTEAHVTAELEALSPLVSVGCHLVVEDTNIHGHPVCPEFPRGPAEALIPFLHAHDDFEVDPRDGKFLVSFNPGGVLRRVR